MLRVRLNLYAIVLAMGLSCISLNGIALNVDLNHASISLPDQSQSSLDQAMKQGFAQVLIKSSGNANINTLPAIEQAEQHMTEYVLSYHVSQQGQQATLNITYDPKAIKQLLTDNGQTFWAANRPQSLVWLNVPDSTGVAHFLASGAQAPMIQVLEHWSQARGVPMLLPVMDLRDQNAIGANPANWFDVSHLTQAAKRYQLHSVLLGQVVHRPDGWQARWLAVLNGEPEQWQTNGHSEQVAMTQGLDQFADILASHYALLTNGQQQVTLTIAGLQGLSDYAKLLKYLQGLSLVNAVTLNDMQPGATRLSLSVNGSADQLKRLLAEGTVLKPQGDVYQYQGVAS